MQRALFHILTSSMEPSKGKVFALPPMFKSAVEKFGALGPGPAAVTSIPSI